MNSMGKTALIFPGQGSQTVGMGFDLHESYSSAAEVFKLADEALGISLSEIIFEGPEEELKKTINTQPAIVTMSLACLAALNEASGKSPFTEFCCTAGHSLGEYTSLAASGVLSIKDTIFLARERGRLMHEAGLKSGGSMAAVIGLGEEPINEIASKAKVTVANYNCPGQIVLSGTEANIQNAMKLAEEGGASRVIQLQVSGAFHSELMQPAAEGLSKVIDNLTFSNPKYPIVANTTANYLETAEQVKEELLNQLTQSVKWQDSVETMIASGVDNFIEIGPGRVLCGLLKRINRSVKASNVCDKASVEKLLSNL